MADFAGFRLVVTHGDAAGSARLPRPADAGSAQRLVRQASGSGNYPEALQRQVPRTRRPHPVTVGWPPASEREHANGDANGGGRLPRPTDASPAQRRGRKSSASGNFPQALRGRVPREQCLNPVASGWPPASGSEDAGGDGRDGGWRTRTLAGKRRRRTGNGKGVKKVTSRVQVTVRQETSVAWRETERRGAHGRGLRLLGGRMLPAAADDRLQRSCASIRSTAQQPRTWALAPRR